nr:MAG TPA: hypothetical protein [Caudoviricetes sp.]
MMDLTMGFYQRSMMTMKKIGERNNRSPKRERKSI